MNLVMTGRTIGALHATMIIATLSNRRAGVNLESAALSTSADPELWLVVGVIEVGPFLEEVTTLDKEVDVVLMLLRTGFAELAALTAAGGTGLAGESWASDLALRNLARIADESSVLKRSVRPTRMGKVYDGSAWISNALSDDHSVSFEILSKSFAFST